MTHVSGKNAAQQRATLPKSEIIYRCFFVHFENCLNTSVTATS